LVAEVGDLAMLLAYFIELDPSPEQFGELLARCANDPRPGVADSARVLQRSWENGLTGADALPLPPLAEVLRTMGAVLDAEPAQAFELALLPGAVVVEGSAGYLRVLLADELTALAQNAADQRHTPAPTG
jgi:hypothetical protein